MGFGAAIATGQSNTLLPETALNSIVEVRIEQSLSEPTRFAIRFQDDIRDGQMRLSEEPALAVDSIITIGVEAGDRLVCLVRGPITESSSELMLGGPGSSYEVHGLDRRDLLDRECKHVTWTGLASTAASAILAPVFPAPPDVEPTTRVYQPGGEGLSQRVTDLAFLSEIARRNNFSFWVTYECTPSLTGGLTVLETAHLRSSPRRPEGGGALASAISLIPTTDSEIRVHVPGDECPNVTAFRVQTDNRRPSAYHARSLDNAGGSATPTDATDPQPATGRGVSRLGERGPTRDLCMPGAGDPQETRNRGEAALTEAGWFVRATASTTSHLLGGVLVPHEIVPVKGVGRRHGTAPFRVREVTHVINAAAHHMDLVLDSNNQG
jgi:hypothetical protein